MATAPERSMNAEMAEGSTDGSYKKLLQNVGNVGRDARTDRRDLNDIWFGIHESPTKVTPDGKVVRTPNFVR